MQRPVTILSMFLLLTSVANLSLAGQPPGLEKKGKVPPGFSEGKKSGWDSVYPPGWEKRSAREKQEWKDVFQKGSKRIENHAKEKGFSEQEVESALDDYGRAVNKGMDPKDGETLVREKIEKGRKGQSFSNEVTQESEKHLKKKRKQKKNKKSTSG